MSDVLVDTLQKLEPDISKVNLVNYYHGLPVIHPAQVLEYREGYLRLQIEPDQAVCLFLENKTCLSIEGLPQPYAGSVLSVDIQHCQAVIADFHEAGETVLERRSSNRVQPEDLVDVLLESEGCRIAGRLADISMHGVGAFAFDTYIYCTETLRHGALATVTLQLPGTDRAVQLMGKIIHISRRRDPRLQRIGIRLIQDPATTPIIQQYVNARQEELRRELNFIYQSILSTR